MLDTVKGRCYILCSKARKEIAMLFTVLAGVTLMVVCHMATRRTRYRF